MKPAPRQFDPAQLELLRGLRGGGLLPRLLVTYREQVARELPALEAARTAGDIAAIARIAHTLKSASFSVGARRMGDLCTALEQEARAGVTEQLPCLCTELLAAHARLLPELESLL